VPSASERKTLFFTSFGIELTLGSVSVITDPSRQPRCPRIGSVMRRPFAGPRGSSAPCWSGVSRTVGTCRLGWRSIYSSPCARWCTTCQQLLC